MLKTVKSAIEKYGMLDSTKNVMVALSGGADSVALLHALWTLKDELHINLQAAHLNHGIRGEDADSDEEFVKALCERLGVELFIEHADVPKIAASTKESLELAARNVRYDFLNRVSSGVIATAHTASDNIETVLFNMSRGSGLDGLCGIPPVRDNVIRPLILVTRQEVEKYCTENGLQFCHDKTNDDVAYARNRIRHNVVPELTKVNDGAVLNVSRLTCSLTEDADFIKCHVDNCYSKAFVDGGLLVTELCDQHFSIKKRMIAKLCLETTGFMPEEVHINSICEMLTSGKSRVSFKGNFEATLRKGILRIEKKVSCAKNEIIKIDSFPYNTEKFEINCQNLENNYKFNSLFLKNAIDCDKICGELVLRHRNPGDDLRIIGRNMTKTLKKLFNESDLSAEQKQKLWVLADDNGVLWVESFGADERVLVDENTKCAIMINNF